MDLLEEVSDLLGGSSVPFLTSLRALVPAFSSLSSIPHDAVAPPSLGWAGEWVQFSCTLAWLNPSAEYSLWLPVSGRDGRDSQFQFWAPEEGDHTGIDKMW